MWLCMKSWCYLPFIMFPFFFFIIALFLFFINCCVLQSFLLFPVPFHEFFLYSVSFRTNFDVGNLWWLFFPQQLCQQWWSCSLHGWPILVHSHRISKCVFLATTHFLFAVLQYIHCASMLNIFLMQCEVDKPLLLSLNTKHFLMFVLYN